MTSVAYPFLRIGSSALKSGDWLVGTSGESPSVLGDNLPYWDYTVDLDLTRVIEVDMETAATQLQIPVGDLELATIVTAGIGSHGGIRNRRVAWHGALSADNSLNEVAFSLAGRDLSQFVTLTTEIILARVPHGYGRLSPRRPGMRLWREVLLVQLEGDGRRFPVEAVSFRQLVSGPSPSALFYLDAGHDPDHEFTGSIRLYLNADQPVLMERIAGGDATTLQLIVGQVMAQLLRQVLVDNHFDPEDAQPGSVGAVVGSWVTLAFPEEPLEAVRLMARREPARFEAALSALAAAQVSSNA